MATIILKATDRKLDCTLEQCNSINKMKENGYNPKTPLNISGTVVELGDIRYAIPDGEYDRNLRSEANKETNDAYLEETNARYRSEMITLLRLPIEKKAQNVSLAKLVWQAYTGEINPPQTFLDEVVKRQFAYFQQYPRHAFANPSCYKNLLIVQEERNSVDRANYVNLCRGALLRIVQRTIEESYSVLRTI